ncbi:MAG: 3-coathanger stack domain-containing protein, partial [Bacteroidota bacterium]
GVDQFNGNIKGIRWNNKAFQVSGQQSAYAYSYDRNNWLTAADYGQVNNGSQAAQDNITNNSTYNSGSNTTLEAGNSVTLQPGFHARNGSIFRAYIKSAGSFSEVGNGDYDVTGITYDANGNIKTLKRNKDANGGNAMDDLTYTYKTNPQDGPNQLLRVDDAAGDVANADDIGDQSGNNYVYNQIGQLVENVQENLKYYYNAVGLVTEVRKNNVPAVKFYYNERNHRVRKEIFNSGGTSIGNTYYVRDVSGQVVAIYNNSSLQEQPIYGASRIGLYRRSNGVATYEIKDHLGSVRVIFQKTGSSTVNEDHNDYYPFGMPMPGKNSVNANIYRYAYQGKEKDSETGNEAFELRLWDGRIGRWLTTDPKKEFSSPYLGIGNNPIRLIDPDGGSTEENPIYGSDGTFRGFDEFGWEGEAIIYDGEFSQGMSQSEVFANGGKLFSNLTGYERFQFMGKGWAHYQEVKMFAEKYEFTGFEPEYVELQVPEVTIIGGGAMDFIGGKGAINLFKYLRNPGALKHIFRNASGHVNPKTIESQNRYLNLFKSVASNSNNLVKTTNAQKIQAGIETFHKTFRNGKQVWVETIGGKIANAGVNNIPR